MNGAESLVRTLVDCDVNVCFANPGTSEMHFVAALDRVPGMRCVLGLFEGVVTGAADGYARMAGGPAATLLHLGPGFGNGLANTHNAHRAYSPMVNIVGEHATYHLEHNAPLTSDIEGIARPVSDWVRTSPDALSIARDGAEAVAAARTAPGQIATLILPADTAWGEAHGPAEPVAPPAAPRVPEERLQAIAKLLRRGEPTVIYMTGEVLLAKHLEVADRIAQATGARLLGQVANGRHERGAGRVPLERLPYPVDQALATLQGVRHVVLLGTDAPVAFFAYPNKPSLLIPEGCEVHRLAEIHEDGVHALQWLCDALGAGGLQPRLQAPSIPDIPTAAPLEIETVSRVIGASIPDNAIVIDEAITSGRELHPFTVGAAPHDWLQICGGAIGIGFPLAVGASIACPDRPILGLQADGSGMYTLQGLWTQAREGLNVTTLVYANRRYAILEHEFRNVGAQTPGQRAKDMFDIDRPTLDWVSLARGMGVEAERVEDTDGLMRALARGFQTSGPYLVEAAMM